MINASCCAEDPELLTHQLQVGLLVPALVPSSRVVLGLADPSWCAGPCSPFPRVISRVLYCTKALSFSQACAFLTLASTEIFANHFLPRLLVTSLC